MLLPIILLICLFHPLIYYFNWTLIFLVKQQSCNNHLKSKNYGIALHSIFLDFIKSSFMSLSKIMKLFLIWVLANKIAILLSWKVILFLKAIKWIFWLVMEKNYRPLVANLFYSNPASNRSRWRKDFQETFGVINFSSHSNNFHYV